MKERLDVLLVKRNLAESREKAKAIIMSGNVFVEGQREDKAGTTFSDEVHPEHLSDGEGGFRAQECAQIRAPLTANGKADYGGDRSRNRSCRWHKQLVQYG